MKVLVINLVDLLVALIIIGKVKGDDVLVIFFNKDLGVKVIGSYEYVYYVGIDFKEFGVI